MATVSKLPSIDINQRFGVRSLIGETDYSSLTKGLGVIDGIQNSAFAIDGVFQSNWIAIPNGWSWDWIALDVYNTGSASALYLGMSSSPGWKGGLPVVHFQWGDTTHSARYRINAGGAFNAPEVIPVDWYWTNTTGSTVYPMFGQEGNLPQKRIVAYGRLIAP